MTPDNDIAVIGGGLSGFAAALVCAAAGRKTLLFAPKGPVDRRTSALMMPSIDILRRHALIDDPAEIGTALEKIRIIDATNRLLRTGETLFESSEAGVEAFGYNLPNAELLEAFAARADAEPNLTVVETAASRVSGKAGAFEIEDGDGSTHTVSLIVGADGKKSSVRAFAGIGTREHAYDQAALVANLKLSRPLESCSVEFHYENGPFTLVPAGDNNANLVWIDRRGVLDAAKADPERLAATINEKSSHLFGLIELTSPAFIFELMSLTANRFGKDGVVLVGESAHAFPPIGAQGLNLGLRDVESLSEALEGASLLPSGAEWSNAVSDAYEQGRRRDVTGTGLFVDTLFRTLIAGFLPADAVRLAGLTALRSLPGLRKSAFRLGMGAR